MRGTEGYTSWDHKQNNIMKELQIQSIMKFMDQYQLQWKTMFNKWIHTLLSTYWQEFIGLSEEKMGSKFQFEIITGYVAYSCYDDDDDDDKCW